MTRIIDLDVLVPDDLAVRIDGELYKLPSDIPIPEYLRLSRTWDRVRELQDGEKTAEDAAEATELLEDLYEQILALLRSQQPDLEDLPIGPRRLGALIISIYADLATEEEPERPTKPRTGTRNTSRKRSTKSRSST